MEQKVLQITKLPTFLPLIKTSISVVLFNHSTLHILASMITSTSTVIVVKQ
jgi:hypothetical protein